MEPVRDYSALVDLLDHALQKGLYISADVIISVADVPLIGLNLRLALANIQTMFNYGLMRDWDEARRGLEREKYDEVIKEKRVVSNGKDSGSFT